MVGPPTAADGCCCANWAILTGRAGSAIEGVGSACAGVERAGTAVGRVDGTRRAVGATGARAAARLVHCSRYGVVGDSVAHDGCGRVDVAVVPCRAGQARCGRAAPVAGVVRAGAALDGGGGVDLAIAP